MSDNLARNAGISLKPVEIAELDRLAEVWRVSRSDVFRRMYREWMQEHREEVIALLKQDTPFSSQ